jgi:hypothetical protein
MNSVSSNRNIAFSTSNKDLIIREVNPDLSKQYQMVSNQKKYSLTQQVLNNDLILNLSQNEEAGIYSLEDKGDVLTRIGLNIDRTESYFKPLDLSALDKYDNIELQNWDTSLAHLDSDVAIGFGAWKWWVILALSIGRNIIN